MINQVNTDRVDEAIDSFEESWSLESRSQIRSLLERFQLLDDSAAMTELIRIDIELRYAQGIPIRLEEYLDEFGTFLGEAHDIAQIAFEDFRSREAYGHPVSSSRWRGIPGVDKQSWFRNLTRQHAEIIPARRSKEVDETFESALEAIGFRLIHELGRGAFSQVFLATQNELADRYVVLKIIDQAVSEPQNMAMLQHTNIVPIYSFDRILARSVICMPYAGRVTMADFLKGGTDVTSRGGEFLVTTVLNHIHDTKAGADDSPDSLIPGMATPAAEEMAVLRPLQRLRALGCNDLAIWLFQRLAAALAHSHSRGVLHGDLKPANVLIRNDGEPALLDFNLSQALDREDVKYAGGTLPYMSPETYRVVMGQTVAPHGSSDIYSLGVMLYEFVTGRLPYSSPPSSAAIDLEPAIAARRLPVAWKETDHVSPGLRSIIERCLEYQAADRYESAEQLQQDLDHESKNEPLAYAAETLSTRANKWVVRHPKFVSGGTVAAMLMAILIPIVAWSVWWRNQSLQLAAIATLDGFSHDSAEVLSSVMVDPLRYQESVVAASMGPLEEFGIFGEAGKKAIDAPLMTAAQRTHYRDTIIRHLAQVAFAEVARLRPMVNLQAGESLDAETLHRLDKLLAAAEKYQPQGESRALTHLAAERARLAGDQALYGSLTAQAGKIPADSNNNERYLEAVRLMTYRRWPQAREILTSLADSGIPSAVRWTSLGRSQYSEGLYEQAKISFTQAIERAPDSSRLWLLRGLCYYKLRKYDRAELDFSKSLELEPTLVSGWIDLGLSLMAQDRFQEAVDAANSGLEHSPEHVHLLLLRYRAHEALGDEQAAERDYAEAIKSENVTASSLASRSIARKKRGDYQGALQDLELANQEKPKSISVLKGKASLFAGHMDRTEDAIDLLGQWIALDPTSETARIDRAVLHARLQHFPEAEADLKHAIRPPNSPRTMYQAACVHALFPEPRTKIALAWLSKAIQKGYGGEAIKDDADLDSLRELDEFKAILDTVRVGDVIRAKGKQTKPGAEFSNVDSINSTEEPPSESEQ